MLTLTAIPVLLEYRRSGNFCVAFFHARNVRAFNFRRLRNWRKFYNGENFPIYGDIIDSKYALEAKISMC